MPGRPLFVTFEGVEGSGKSTQARLLYRRLLAEGQMAVLTFEPGGTALGQQLRSLVLGDALQPIAPRSELLIFAAARAQLLAEVVEPALRRGQVVVCDRFAESTLAYQGYGRGLSLESVRLANALATGERRADLVVLLDLPAEDGLRRKSPGDWNRFEREEVAFHERVRAGYLHLAAAEPARWLVLEAAQPLEVLAQRVWERVARELGIPQLCGLESS